MEIFLIGLGIGLLFFIISVINNMRLKKRHKREILRIKNMVTQKMDIEYDSIASLREENETLKKRNENLRISVRTLSQKPNRKEVARLQIYQRAIEIMSMKAPGFAPAWQTAVKESEEEFDRIFLGFDPFVRKVVPSKLLDLFDSKSEESSDEKKNESVDKNT
ncbi:MAG: hypothetical protein K9K80_02600 [Spirochaetia bacterium]|nr:hypothetical protein [Spirochaetia bacterium]